MQKAKPLSQAYLFGSGAQLDHSAPLTAARVGQIEKSNTFQRWISVCVASALLLTVLAILFWVKTHHQSLGLESKLNEFERLQKIKALNIEMIAIPAGEFLMGSPVGQDDERPVHRVKLNAFHLGRTEVTQGQWQTVMGENPAAFQNGKDCPVENVSWDDCMHFIEQLNSLTKRNFRLPTEAEWEYACRAGSAEDRDGVIDLIAWHAKNAEGKTHPVADKLPNAFNLYDMLGNVWEWCQDRYSDMFYGELLALNPQGPVTGSGRVIRGCGWSNYADNMRAAFRNGDKPDFRSNNLGLRLASD